MFSRRLKQKIIWPIVVLYLLQTYFVSNEIFFGISIILVGYSIARSRFQIKKLGIPGLNFYVLLLAFVSLVGITKYSLGFVARDVYYESTNILLIYIGYNLCFERSDTEDIFSTVFVMIALSSIITFITGAFTVVGGVSFATLRETFSVGIKSIEAFLPVYIVYIIAYKKVIISPKIDMLILVVWSVQAIMNMSRTTLFGIAIGIITSLLILSAKKQLNLYRIRKILGITLIIAIIVVIAIKEMPDNVTGRFIDKIWNTFTEVNSRLTFSSLADANSNWRGYEIAQAKNQWVESSLFAKIFGSGNGKLISITYIPDLWQEIVQSQNGITGVTVLHNTYYTLLIKGGVVLVCSFISMFLMNIRKGYLRVRRASNTETIILGTTLVLLSITMMIDAYVIRGMMQNDAQLAWSIMFGWISAKLSKRFSSDAM